MEHGLEHLFERYRTDGDTSALGEVFDRTAPELYRSALRRAGSAAEAEDLVQATFMTAMEIRERFDSTRPVAPWLQGILDRHAKASRAARRPDPHRVAGAEAPSAGDEAARREAWEAFREALEAVPDPYRRVLRLHLLHGLSLRDVAREVGTADATARTRLHRGLELMRGLVPAGLVASAMVLATPGRGLAAVRGAVTAKGATLAAEAAGTTWIGGTLVSKKSMMAALVVALFLIPTVLVVQAWSDDEGHGLGDGASLEGETARGVRRDVTSDGTTAPPAADAAVPAEEALPAGPDGTRPSILVVDERTGEPIPGATVWVADTARISAAERERLQDLGLSDREQYMRLGRRLTTDEEGRAELWWSLGVLKIVARHGELWCDGWSEVTSDMEEGVLVVPVRPEHELRIRVVDGDGRPVPHCPVAVWRIFDLFPANAHRDGVMKARTDETGLATLRTRIGHAMRLRATFGFPLIRPPMSPFVEGEATLVLPPVAGIDVAIAEDLRETLAEKDLVASVSVVSGTRVGVLPRDLPVMGVTGEVQEGRITFPFIGPGLSLDVSVAPSDGSYRLETDHDDKGRDGWRYYPGPTRPGEVLTVTVDRAERDTHFRARLVDPTGDPLSHLAVILIENGEYDQPAVGTSDGLVTDANGVIDRFIWVKDLENARRLEVIALEQLGDAGRHDSWIGTVPIGEDRLDMDVGEIVMRRPEAVIEGRVVDPDGKPVVGAWVWLAQPDPDWPNDESWSEYRTNYLEDAVRTDIGGRFGFVRASSGRRAVVHVRARGFQDTSSDVFDAGEHSPTVRMRRGASLTVSFAELTPAAAMHLEVLVSRDNDMRSFAGSLRGRSTITFHGLEPGDADVHVRVSDDYELAVIENIQLEDGRHCDDPRLENIQLGSLEISTLEVVDASGRPVQGGRVEFTSGGNKYIDAAGRVRFLTQRADDGVTVIGPRLMSRLVYPPFTEPIVLHPGIPVHITFEGSPPPSRIGNHPMIDIRREGSEYLCDSASVIERKEGRFLLPGPGRYRVFIENTWGRRTPGTFNSYGKPAGVIEVSREGGHFHFDLTRPPEKKSK